MSSGNIGRVCGWGGGADDGPACITEDLQPARLMHPNTPSSSHGKPTVPGIRGWHTDKTSHPTLMGPSTGSSPCSDSCFKALRAA